MENNLNKLFKVIIDEVKVNKEFEEKINAIFSIDKPPAKKTKKIVVALPVLDPIEDVKEGKELLEEKLQQHSIEELKTIIKYYNLDNSNAYSKWRKKQRLVNLIIEVSSLRSKKGQAFRNLD